MAFLRTLSRLRRRHAARRCGAVWLLGLTLLLHATGAPAAAPAPVSAENQIKAVFLFNFAQFVEWPAGAFQNAQSPLVIGVLGEDPFGIYLDELVKDEKVGERPVVVRRYRRPDDVAGCHILFITASEAGQLDRVVARLKDHHVLTIGDVDSFSRLGGMVRFVTEGGKIRLRINVQAARAAGLTISSKLLGPSTIVTAGKD